MPVRLRVAVPVFVKVTAWIALVDPTNCPAKLRLVAERLTAGATPVPVSPNDCGLPLALSEIFSEALRFPVAKGIKVTLIVQFAPAATAIPQLLAWAKSLAF